MSFCQKQQLSGNHEDSNILVQKIKRRIHNIIIKALNHILIQYD